jgi:hypothetical protein
VNKVRVVKAPALLAKTTGHLLVEPEEWENRPGQRVIGEYHKKSRSELQADFESQNGTARGMIRSRHDASSGAKLSKLIQSEVMDIYKAEMVASVVFRTAFGKSVRAPLKLKNIIDMDLAVENNNVTLNTNNVSFIPPQLQIWRFIFAYRNKPLLEYGRGISGIKLNLGRALVFGLTMWWVGWKTRWLGKKPAKSQLQKTYSK